MFVQTHMCTICIVTHLFNGQVVRLREVFPAASGFVLVFDYMLSDLSEIVRNAERPLNEVNCMNVLVFKKKNFCLFSQILKAQIKSYMMMLLKGVAYLHSKSIMHRVCNTMLYI